MVCVLLVLSLLWSAFAVSLRHQQPCNVLALSGGGAFGAVEMGVLDTLLATNNIHPRLDIITGISAGGLNAAFLSAYNPLTVAIPKIKLIYETMNTASVYTSNYLRLLTRWGIYDNSPLEKTLRDILTNAADAEMTDAEEGPLTLIGATNLNTSRLDIFEINSMTVEQKIDVLMATTSVPLAFPPRRMNNMLYVDGAMITNELINQVIGQANCSTYSITFISASLRTNKNIVMNGLLTYINGLVHTLINTFDSQMAQQVGHCAYPRGQLRVCYPTAPELDNYDFLNFDYGAQLYKLGQQFPNCSVYALCAAGV
jgi:predicted acylesterase/phospholipase RssA